MIDRTNIARRAVVKGLAAILPAGLISHSHAAQPPIPKPEEVMNIAITNPVTAAKCPYANMPLDEQNERLDAMIELAELTGESLDALIEDSGDMTLTCFRAWVKAIKGTPAISLNELIAMRRSQFRQLREIEEDDELDIACEELYITEVRILRYATRTQSELKSKIEYFLHLFREDPSGMEFRTPMFLYSVRRSII